MLSKLVATCSNYKFSSFFVPCFCTSYLMIILTWVLVLQKVCLQPAYESLQARLGERGLTTCRVANNLAFICFLDKIIGTLFCIGYVYRSGDDTHNLTTKIHGVQCAHTTIVIKKFRTLLYLLRTSPPYHHTFYYPHKTTVENVAQTLQPYF